MSDTTGVSEIGPISDESPTLSQGVWKIDDLITFDEFSPPHISARFFRPTPEGPKKLYWVILFKLDIDTCDSARQVFNDAVHFIKSNYAFSGAEVLDSRKLSTPSCSDFMESNKVIWSAKQKDWWIFATSNYQSKYSVEVNYIYRPLGESKVKAQKHEAEEKKGATRQHL